MTDESLFAAALDRADPRERAAYLAAACPDPEQRARVEKLLAALGKASDFLERPAAGDAPGPTRRRPAEGEPEEPEEPIDFLDPPLRPDSLGRLGHYEVLQLVGRGGFGIVFRAFDDVLQRVVAIKVLSAAMAATSPACKRFVREARGYAAVRHENVVTVHAIEPDPRPYIVMEFIPGETLESLVLRTGPLDPADVVRIGAQIARGLAAAHERGIVHRDIKPANVLIESGPDRKVKITDFGLARVADDASLTQSGMIAGTPMFMAPEQAHGDQLDHRADLFSLGSVLYTLCTGRPPFRAPTSIAVLRRVAEDDPRPIREVIPETPAGLCAVIAKLHAKNPADRYQTAAEAADALAGCLTAPPPAAEPQRTEPQRTEPQKPKSGGPEGAPESPAKGGPRWSTVALLVAFTILVLLYVAAFFVAPPLSYTTQLSRPIDGPSIPPGPTLPGPPPLPPKLSGAAAVLASPDWEWGAPEPVRGEVNTADRELCPTLTSDELVMVFARGPLGRSKLYISRRDSRDEPFGPAEELPAAVNDRTRDATSLSGDGRLLAFSSNRGGREEIWACERANPDAPFGEARKLPAPVNAPGARGTAPVLSADGRTLLVTAVRAGLEGGDVVMYTRAARDDDFGGETALPRPVNSPLYDTACWIADDRLAVVRTKMTEKRPFETRFHVRGSADEPFGEGQKFAIPGVPETIEVGRPWLSPDGSRMYFHAPNTLTDDKGAHLDIWVTERKPKTK